MALTNTNTTAGTLVVNPLVFTPNVGSLNTQFDPLSAGISIIGPSTPVGFSTPSNLRETAVTITGTPPRQSPAPGEIQADAASSGGGEGGRFVGSLMK